MARAMTGSSMSLRCSLRSLNSAKRLGSDEGLVDAVLGLVLASKSSSLPVVLAFHQARLAADVERPDPGLVVLDELAGAVGGFRAGGDDAGRQTTR